MVLANRHDRERGRVHMSVVELTVKRPVSVIAAQLTTQCAGEKNMTDMTLSIYQSCVFAKGLLSFGQLA
jgi:hypothetical protein